MARGGATRSPANGALRSSALLSVELPSSSEQPAMARPASPIAPAPRKRRRERWDRSTMVVLRGVGTGFDDARGDRPVTGVGEREREADGVAHLQGAGDAGEHHVKSAG